jgi:hypothetical protein
MSGQDDKGSSLDVVSAPDAGLEGSVCLLKRSGQEPAKDLAFWEPEPDVEM